jgi:hypothetical protein
MLSVQLIVSFEIAIVSATEQYCTVLTSNIALMFILILDFDIFGYG